MQDRWLARGIGAVGGAGPLTAIVVLFAVSGDGISGTDPGALLAVAAIAALDGAVVAPLTIRPRRRPVRGAVAYGAVAVLGWAAFGMAAAVGEIITGSSSAGAATLLAGRLAVAVLYGLVAMIPLTILGAVWVVVTWFVDGLGDGRAG